MADTGTPEGNKPHGSQVEDNTRILWLKLNSSLSNDNEYVGPPTIHKMLLNYDKDTKTWQTRNGNPDKNNKGQSTKTCQPGNGDQDKNNKDQNPKTCQPRNEDQDKNSKDQNTKTCQPRKGDQDKNNKDQNTKTCQQRNEDQDKNSKDQNTKTCQPRNGDQDKKNKVVMMIGATGSGKTTLINALVNYIFGIQWKYNCRIQLVREDPKGVQDPHQRAKVMVYQINHQPEFCIPHSLTIIDTPELPEVTGETPQRTDVQQIRALFYGSNLDHVDAVCFVAQSSMTSFSLNQRYMFDSLVEMFGPNVKENLVTFLTSSYDDQRPPALATMIRDNVPCAMDKEGCPIHFRFPNGILYEDNSPEDANVATEQLWSLGMEDVSNFFKFLSETSRKTIALQRDELMKRNASEVTVDALVHRIKEVMSKQYELEQMDRVLRQHQVQIEKDECFEFDVISPVKEKIEIDKNCINCRECSSTCHHDCLVAYNVAVYFCEVFYFFSASCRVCGHGSSTHFSEKSLWQNLIVNKKVSYRSIKMKYRRDDQEEMTHQVVLERVSAETERLRNDGCRLILRATDHIRQYTTIRSPEELVEQLIESERRTRRRGYEGRTEMLEKARIQMRRK